MRLRRQKRNMLNIKYIDKIMIYPDSKFAIDTKHGKYSRKYYNTLEDAIYHAHPSGRDGLVSIFIESNSASNKIPGVQIKYRDAIYHSEFAKRREIVLTPSKDRVVYEFFRMDKHIYEFDYEILYGESNNLYNNGDIVAPFYGEFKGKVLQLDTYFPSVSNRNELLDTDLPFIKSDVNLIYMDADLHYIPAFTI